MYSNSRIGYYIQKNADVQSYLIGGAGGALTGGLLGAIYNKLNGKRLLDSKALLTGALAGTAGGLAIGSIHSNIKNKKTHLAGQHKDLVTKNEDGENILAPGLYIKKNEYGTRGSVKSTKSFQHIMRSPSLWDSQVHTDLLEVRSTPFTRNGIKSVELRKGMHIVSISPSRDGNCLNMRFSPNGRPNGHNYRETGPFENMLDWLDHGLVTSSKSENLKPGKWDLSGNMAVYRLSDDTSAGGIVESTMHNVINRARKWGIPDKWKNRQLNDYFSGLIAESRYTPDMSDARKTEILQEIKAYPDAEKEHLFQALQQERGEDLGAGYMAPFRWSIFPQGRHGSQNCNSAIAGLLYGAKGLDFSKVPSGNLFVPSGSQFAGRFGNVGFFTEDHSSTDLRPDLVLNGVVTPEYLNNVMYSDHKPRWSDKPETMEASAKQLEGLGMPMNRPGNSMLSRIIDALGLDMLF